MSPSISIGGTHVPAYHILQNLHTSSRYRHLCLWPKGLLQRGHTCSEEFAQPRDPRSAEFLAGPKRMVPACREQRLATAVRARVGGHRPRHVHLRGQAAAVPPQPVGAQGGRAAAAEAAAARVDGEDVRGGQGERGPERGPHGARRAPAADARGRPGRGRPRAAAVERGAGLCGVPGGLADARHQHLVRGRHAAAPRLFRRGGGDPRDPHRRVRRVALWQRSGGDVQHVRGIAWIDGGNEGRVRRDGLDNMRQQMWTRQWRQSAY
mmetsp:Transcript_11332/g.23664  ORF Transcript_11332/g.23664 Transcript_11332/m.23664 type:complete len:265 (+) Transcript_11332:730-1524(+)